MTILGIESSCDDTSVALLEVTENGIVVIAEKTASQIEVHKKYGGVVPEIAGRKHAENILPVVEEVLREGTRLRPPSLELRRTTDGQAKKPDIDAIAVTAGPGLMAGLIVGAEVAKTLSYLWGIPVVRVNHIEGHIYSVLLGQNKLHPVCHSRESGNPETQKKIPAFAGMTVLFPALCLVVSGGHTELILMKDHGEYELVGKTRDDAAGEAFDKVAKLLDLEYPGGPKISKLAEDGNTRAIPFPRPMLKEDTYDFSFAGLKTAALYWLRDNKLSAGHTLWSDRLPSFLRHGWGMSDPKPTINDFCASFEQAIVDVLVSKAIRAATQHTVKTIILGGGVSANKKIRETLASAIKSTLPETQFLTCPREYSMDNAAMIAVAGSFHAAKQDFTPWQKLEADPNWKIYDRG